MKIDLLSFNETNVGLAAIAYKWDILLSNKEYYEVKKKLPEYFQNGVSYLFVKDTFKDMYVLRVHAYFEITPFNSKEHAEKYMSDDNVFLLYSKHPMMAELNDIRYTLIQVGE